MENFVDFSFLKPISRADTIEKVTDYFETFSKKNIIVVQGEHGTGKDYILQQSAHVFSQKGHNVLFGEADTERCGIEPGFPIISAVERYFYIHRRIFMNPDFFPFYVPGYSSIKDIPELSGFSNNFSVYLHLLAYRDFLPDIVFRRIFQFLCKLAVKNKLVLIIRDIDKSDKQSLQFFKILSEYLGEDILILGSAVNKVNLDNSFTRILKIKRFSKFDLEEVIKPVSFVEQLYKVTKGNALYIKLILKKLFLKKLISQESDEQIKVTLVKEDTALDFPETIEKFLEEEFADFSKLDRFIATICSLAFFECKFKHIKSIIDIVEPVEENKIKKSIEKLKKSSFFSILDEKVSIMAPYLRKFLKDRVISEAPELFAKVKQAIFNFISMLTDSKRINVKFVLNSRIFYSSSENLKSELLEAGKVAYMNNAFLKSRYIWTKFLKYKDEKENIKILKYLGDISWFAGDSEKAYEYFLNSYKIAKKYKDAENGCLALFSLINSYIRNREFEHAEKYLNILEDYTNYPWVAMEYNNLWGNYYYRKGDLKKAFECYKSNLQRSFARTPENLVALSRTFVGIGMVYFHYGEFSESLKMYEKALKSSFLKLSIYDKFQTYHHLGMAYLKLNNYEQAFIYYAYALMEIEKNGDLFSAAKIFVSIGIAYFYKADWKSALKEFEKALQFSKHIGDSKGIAMLTGNIGRIHARCGEFTKANIYLKQDLLMVKEMDDEISLAYANFYFGEYKFLRENFDEAVIYFKTAYDFAKKLDLKELAIESLCGIVDCEIENKNIEQVEKYMLLLKKEIKKIENHLLVGQVYRVSGKFEILKNKIDIALSLLSEAEKRFVEAGLNYEISIIKYELSKACFLAKRKEEAKKYYEEARIISRQINNQPLLEKIKKFRELLILDTESLK